MLSRDLSACVFKATVREESTRLPGLSGDVSSSPRGGGGMDKAFLWDDLLGVPILTRVPLTTTRPFTISHSTPGTFQELVLCNGLFPGIGWFTKQPLGSRCVPGIDTLR